MVFLDDPPIATNTIIEALNKFNVGEVRVLHLGIKPSGFLEFKVAKCGDCIENEFPTWSQIFLVNYRWPLNPAFSTPPPSRRAADDL